MTALAVSPHGDVAAVGGRGQVLLFDTGTRALLGVLPFPEGMARTLRFSRSGRLLIAGGGIAAQSGRVVVWDVAEASRLFEGGNEFDEILATDISDVVLEQARTGSYGALEMARGLPDDYRQKYFVPLLGRWSISQDCRQLVEFRQFNLAAPWQGIPACDIVFLRNVLIYFDIPTRARIIEQVRGVLRPDGCLFIGGAETLLGVSDAFERLQGAGCGYYRPKGAR